jgi:hypothetical protein
MASTFEKNGSKIWASSEIFEKLPKVNNILYLLELEQMSYNATSSLACF